MVAMTRWVTKPGLSARRVTLAPSASMTGWEIAGEDMRAKRRFHCMSGSMPTLRAGFRLRRRAAVVMSSPHGMRKIMPASDGSVVMWAPARVRISASSSPRSEGWMKAETGPGIFGAVGSSGSSLRASSYL